ncbi:MAG: hypothetical protein LBL75_01615 [Rickettsiales bacterium]|jgi:hypothetical protein|nr:hypothetical protein [Rickettsiales bacterium]
MKDEVINEIIKRLKTAFRLERRFRKQWVAAGFNESAAPTAIGLIGDAESGYECLRSAWWHSLGCDKIADGLDYMETSHAVERTKIKGLSFGS